MPKLIIIFTLLSVSLSNAVVAKTFKIATLSPSGSFWITTMKSAAKEVAEKTEDRVKFRFYPGGVMGNDKSVLKKIRVGQLQGAAFSGGGLASKAPSTQLYNIPLLFRSYEEVDFIREQLDAELEQDFDDAGFVNFGLAEGGFAYIMSKNRISAVQDLKNNKVWVPSDDAVSQAASDSFGIAPIALSLGDVLTGLQTGLIDTVAASPIGAIALQWHTQVEYVLELPIIYIYALLAIDKKAYAKIEAADQAIVNEVMRRTFNKIDAQNRKDNTAAFMALENQGLTRVLPDPAQLLDWKSRGEAAADNFISQGRIDPALLSRVNKLLADFRAAK